LSDSEVVAALDALELLLQGVPVEAEAIRSWRVSFDQALASAEHGSGWPAIASRAHALATRLDAAAADLSAQQGLLRREMNLHSQGARALRGYKPG